ncbi:catechol O-methyltransferase A isoform X1 [Megalobrama amblycephala]|uniref:catechol O-methyltransferase A isoform X1 n=2 Tax=Megalobrama amblycephala TaxID=75352 RepID=UPI0020146F88|nr:catechol O-methyltransferase A isoform X1 [Megalobrama amblycephala]
MSVTCVCVHASVCISPSLSSVTIGCISLSTHIKADQQNRMPLSLLAVAVVSAAVLYVLYRWLIPAAVQNCSWLALLWHDVILQRVLNITTGSSRPQRMLKAVQKNATKGDPKSVISAIDYYCRHKEWAMNVGDDKGLILDSVLTEVNPSTALELGTYCGYSSVRIARLLSPDSKLITIEFNPAFAAIARQIIAYAGLQDKVTLVEGASGDLIPKMKERFGIKSFDFVFLDHWKDRYVPDTKLLEDCGLLKKGTVLLADNVICPGAPEYLQYVRNNPRYESRYYPSNLEYTKVEDGLEKSVFLG